MAPQKTYLERSKTHPTAVGRRLLEIMELKKSNLCLSVDLTDPWEVCRVVDELGPKICLLKTHIDILSFTTISPSSLPSIPSLPSLLPSLTSPTETDIILFTKTLLALSKIHNFLLFEDRKFADIGSTVQSQYRHGIYRISSWAHITTAHSVPGDGIIRGLASVAKESTEPRGLLLLAEMSSEGTLSGGEYAVNTIAMARRYKEFVMGFVAMGAIEAETGKQGEGEEEEEDWIIMTPGVGLSSGGDGLGQRYRTPEEVVGERGSDVIIVGRGILNAHDRGEAAEMYRDAGWGAYEKRISGSL